jgi:hypothetical protein
LHALRESGRMAACDGETMRRPWIALALLLGGCAAAGIEPAALGTPIETDSIGASAGAGETARGALHRAQHQAVEEARRPLRAFLADKNADCSSPRLKEAVSKVTEMASALATAMRPDYRAMLEAGAAVLDVADGAKARGCARDAKELYAFVVRTFAGLGFAELRERATAGIKDLRARG